MSRLARGGPGREGVLRDGSEKFLNLLPEWKGLFVTQVSQGDSLKMNPDPGRCRSRRRPMVWQVLGESAYEALYFARATLEVLYDAFPKFIGLPLESQFSMFFVARSWPRLFFVKYAKYCTVWPLARYLHQILPPKPQDFEGSPLLFTGPAKRILKNRLVSHSPHNLRLWNSYLQGIKRGCAVVDDITILNSLKSHQEAMLARDPMGDYFHEVFVDYTLRLLPNFDPDWKPPRKSRPKPGQRRPRAVKVEPVGFPFRPPVPRLFEASPSAAFEANRSDGGGRDYIRAEQDRGLLKIVETAPGVIEEVHGTRCPNIQDVIPRALKLDNSSFGCATVSAVLEPLKVRLITKGSAYPQWISRFFQKGLWDYLQKYPQFALTGRPMDASDLAGILLRERKLDKRHRHLYGIPMFRDPKWVSGDFSSATDNQSISATKILLEAFLGICSYSHDLEEILRSVIYEQKIHYPKQWVQDNNWCHGCWKDSCPFCTYEGQRLLDKGVLDQTNGQLMGSVLSFPLLCLTNLIAYWSALEERIGMRVRPQDLPVLVNGDDILFRADEDLLDIWEMNIEQCGFKLSLGKNYVHDSVLMVNSEMYIYSETSTGNFHFKHVPFFNVGLLTGQSKLTGRTQTREKPLPDVWNETCPGACNQERALKRFIHYMSDDVRKWTKEGNYNLFIPVWRGGLGFMVPEGHHFNVTSFQQRFAAKVRLSQIQCYDTGRLPKGLAMGLLRELEGKVLKFKHFHYLMEVQYGPLKSNQVEVVDRDVRIPILAGAYDLEPVMKLRFPKNLQGIRDGTIPRMSLDLVMQPPPRVVEYNPWNDDFLSYLADDELMITSLESF